MMTFLFWNLKGNDQKSWPNRKDNLLRHIARMVPRHNVDFLLFTESFFDAGEVVEGLAKETGVAFEAKATNNKRFQVFMKAGAGKMVLAYNSPDERLGIWRVNGNEKSYQLCLIHLPSRSHWKPESISDHAAKLMDQIRLHERFEKSTRTVVVGDFNLNPFENGIIGSHAFAGMMTKVQALGSGDGSRIIQSKAYRLFYNPMWSCFGDRTPGPPGSFFYSRSEHINQGWHIFDQVLLSHEVMDELGEVRILDSDGIDSLLTRKGRPNAGSISDHLPLLFTLTDNVEGQTNANGN